MSHFFHVSKQDITFLKTLTFSCRYNVRQTEQGMITHTHKLHVTGLSLHETRDPGKREWLMSLPGHWTPRKELRWAPELV